MYLQIWSFFKIQRQNLLYVGNSLNSDSSISSRYSIRTGLLFACVNAEQVFHITKKEQSIISSHMWPLTFRHVPSCREAIIVCLADKYCAVVESMFKRSRVAAAKNANGEYDEW